MPLRRTGTVTDAGVWYGPGSAVQREERCTASGTRVLRHERANSLDGATIRSFNRCDNGSRWCAPAQAGVRPMWILLLLPFIGLLWVPFYNFQEPALFGFPFFYWYQLAWVPISSLLIWLVYRSRKPDEVS
jgi:Protein of unknown function (DUF3311)